MELGELGKELEAVEELEADIGLEAQQVGESIEDLLAEDMVDA